MLFVWVKNLRVSSDVIAIVIGLVCEGAANSVGATQTEADVRIQMNV